MREEMREEVEERRSVSINNKDKRQETRGEIIIMASSRKWKDLEQETLPPNVHAWKYTSETNPNPTNNTMSPQQPTIRIVSNIEIPTSHHVSSPYHSLPLTATREKTPNIPNIPVIHVVAEITRAATHTSSTSSTTNSNGITSQSKTVLSNTNMSSDQQKIIDLKNNRENEHCTEFRRQWGYSFFYNFYTDIVRWCG